MFNSLPLEVVEKILCYLSVMDIVSVFSAFQKNYNILSHYFWKTLCSKEDFLQAYENQEWYDSFQSGANKKLGHYVHLTNIPQGSLEYVYLSSLIVSEVEKQGKVLYKVFFIDNSNEFILTQTITDAVVQFKENYLLIDDNSLFTILKYNLTSHKYTFFKSLQEPVHCVFGINNKYCLAHRAESKVFNIYFLQNEDVQPVTLPQDSKFIIEKVLHQDNVVISSLTFDDGYKIKVYNIESRKWILDLVCFGSTGISNDPNVWIGSNFVGCCDVSYRLRGIYFGPFKVWNKSGVKLFQADIEPSTKHYLRCFLKEENIILTTSDNTITVFNSMGKSVLNIYIRNTILDIKLSTGHLILVLTEEDLVKVYDWSLGSYLYSIKLHLNCNKIFSSDFVYCPVSVESNKFEVIKFF